MWRRELEEEEGGTEERKREGKENKPGRELNRVWEEEEDNGKRRGTERKGKRAEGRNRQQGEKRKR